MSAPLKPPTVMMLRQCLQLATVWMPMFLLLAWAFSGELVRMPIAVGAAGALLLAHWAIRPTVAKARARGAASTGRLRLVSMANALRVPVQFDRFGTWSVAAAQIAFIAGVNGIDDFGFTGAFIMMTATWAVATGFVWCLWWRGGLRNRADPTPERYARPTGIELVRDMGDHAAPHALRWRAMRRTGELDTAGLIRDITRSGFLPPISGGERRWRVAVDGDPIAVVTQTWSGARWWPEPEWLIDPHAPFTGERVDFALHEPQRN